MPRNNTARKAQNPTKMEAFERMCDQEPLLWNLYEDACAIQDDRRKRRFCAHDYWYGTGFHPGFRRLLSGLVGNCARRQELATHEAYNVAYDVIYEALPNCRNCGCVPL